MVRYSNAKNECEKFRVNIPLMEVGNFEAKAFIKLFDGEIKWPDGSNTKIKANQFYQLQEIQFIMLS